MTTPSPPTSRRNYDVIIVGAGIAGTALAYSLGSSGRKVLLLERDLSTPDRIVGELLQPGGCASLRALGMGECLEGIDAVRVEGYHIEYNGHKVAIPYPPSPAGQGSGVGETSSGLIEGRSFVHGAFVDSLRAKAKSGENVTLLEATVKDLQTCSESSRVIGVRASVKPPPSSSSFLSPSDSTSPSSTLISSKPKDTSFFAPLTIIADGCFSRFRSPLSPPPETRSHFVGLVLHHAPLPAPNHGNVILGKDCVTLLYQISSTETRMLVDVKGKLPSNGNGDLRRWIEERVVRRLPEGLRECVGKALEESETIGGEKRLRVMPNSWLPPRMQTTKGDREGCLVVGDAWNMRHPLTGGGMTVALHDCIHLTRILSPSPALPDLDDWHVYAPAIQRWHWERKNLAAVVNVLSIALYDLFGADDDNLEVLRAGCFKYFQLGGQAVSGPVSLLSALAPKPLLLLYHFFAVALYSIWCMFFHPQLVPGSNRQKDAVGEKAYGADEKAGAGGASRAEDQGVWKVPSVTEYPRLLVKSWMVFYVACVVILPKVWDELQ